MLHWPIVKRLVVAVDGPSGAGKGTVARAAARALGYRHVDTGAMYRAVAWRAAQTGIALDDDAGLAAVAAGAAFALSDGVVGIDGHDVTSAIRTPAMDKAAALVARNPAVRDVLVTRQRALGAAGAVVMEGRDIGTVVFPDADVKIYLDASHEERARRRAADPAHTRSGTDIADVAQDLAARDKSDSTRSVAPLTQAADAVYIDTTSLPVDDVVARVLSLVREKEGSRASGSGSRD